MARCWSSGRGCPKARLRAARTAGRPRPSLPRANWPTCWPRWAPSSCSTPTTSRSRIRPWPTRASAAPSSGSTTNAASARSAMESPAARRPAGPTGPYRSWTSPARWQTPAASRGASRCSRPHAHPMGGERRRAMSARRGCGLLAFLALFLLVACLVFAALSAGLVMTGELPAFEPRLTGLEPQPGFAFRPTTPITLTFDQPMDPASVESSFALVPAVPGSLAWNQDYTQVVFLPSGPGFEPGMRYRARLADGARAGLLPRTTRNAVEWGFSLPPLLADSSPAPGTAGLGPLPLLSARFNYALDCDATSQSFVITPPVPGSVDCQAGTWSFTPSVALAPDAAYSAGLQQVYLDGDPAPRPGPSWQFRTAPPLLVVDVAPGVDQLVADLWTPVAVTFNRPPVAETVEGRFGLADADGTPVEGEISWENGGTTLVFRPTGALKPLFSYRWRLEAGVQDALGFALAEALSRPFDTAAIVGVRDPGPDADVVSLTRPLRLSFTRPMDRDSVEAGLVLTPALQGEIAWEGDTLVFTPQDGWQGGTDYKVRLDAEVRDASGAPLAEALSWTFRSEPFLVEASVPAGEVLRLAQPLQLRFALPMDRASVERALVIAPDTPGELTWSDGDRTLPLDYRVYDKPKDGLTKNDHFRDLIAAAKRRGFRPRAVLFDRWYSSLDNLKQVRTCGWTFLTQLKANRKVDLDRQGYRAVALT
ncbi:MAG: hypothetical protein EHM56_06485, partial [Chloroflexi bacterium]